MRIIILLVFLIFASGNLISQEVQLKTGFYKVVDKDSCDNSKGYIIINDSGTDYCISQIPMITDANFESANITTDTTERGVTYVVSIKLDSSGTQVIKDATSKMVGQKAAFVINNEIVAAPTVRDPITTGRVAVFCDKETIEKVRKALKIK